MSTTDMAVTTIRNFPMEHPKQVSNLFECLDKVQAIALDEPDWKFVDRPHKVQDIVLTLARNNAIQAEPMRAAMQRVNNLLKGKLVIAVRENIDHYLEQLTPGFEQAAEAYTEAVAQLPDGFTLTNATEEQFKAYSTARDAAGVIEAAKSFVMDSIALGTEYMGEIDPWFTVVHAHNPEQFKAVQFYSPTGRETTEEKQLNPALLNAVKAGCTLSLATTTEARARVADLAHGHQHG